MPKKSDDNTGWVGPMAKPAARAKSKARAKPKGSAKPKARAKPRAGAEDNANTGWVGPMLVDAFEHFGGAAKPRDVRAIGKIIQHIGEAAETANPDARLKARLRGLSRHARSVARRVPRLAKLVDDRK